MMFVSTFNIFIALIFHCRSLSAQSCDDTPMLPNLYRRSRTYSVDQVETNEPLVNDFFLNDGWYSVEDQTGTYFMVSNNTVPDIGTCGSVFVIYMIGDYPNETTVPEGTEVDATACIRSYFSRCDDTYDIKIRNCNGMFQYYLVSTPSPSAYCFDHDFVRDIKDFPPAPDNASLGSLKVIPHLRHRIETNDEGDEIGNPFLEFECSFNWEDGFYYKVIWFYNDILLSNQLPSNITSELYLQESKMLQEGVPLGVNLKCGVSVSIGVYGLQTPVNYSRDFFAGIKFNNQEIIVPKTSSGEQITFRLTVPIGCTYIISNGAGFCEHYLQMFERTFNCSGTEETIQSLLEDSHTGTFRQDLCGTAIQTFRGYETWDSTKEYSITIVTREEDYSDRTHFFLDLRMENKSPSAGHAIWSNYQPESILVTVNNTDANYHKYCYSHVDPHMKTPDGEEYEQQRTGTFLLYRNTEFDSEVHEKTESCNGNRATCTCAVAIRAGADVVIFNTCGNVRFIGYTDCGDGGILRTKEVTGTEYEIHTPIGTYIKLVLNPRVGYQGMMNVNIYMSPKDFNRTDGLCGLFDGEPSNDYTAKDGIIHSNNLDYQFSESWRLDEQESLLRPNLQLSAWSDENKLFCYCNNTVTGALTEEATCSASQFEGCSVIDTGDVTQKFCTLVEARKKRSASNFYNEQHRRFQLSKQPKRTQRMKRSIVNITEEEANTTCTEAISNSFVATNLTDMLGAGEVENKIEQCIYDVLDSNDLSYATVHVDTLNAIATFHIAIDPVYAANNTELVTAFKQQSCPSNCSSQGTCINGTCSCFDYYHGGDCSIDIRDQLTIDDITGGGICDTLTSDCTCFDVQTTGLIENFQFLISSFNLNDQGNITYLDTTYGHGEYLSIFEGIVCFTSDSSIFFTQHNLSISNDGTTFSSPVSIHVYDSTCQEYTVDDNGIYNFSLKSGFCHIAGQCFQENDVLASDNCSTCNSSANMFNWTYACQESAEGVEGADYASDDSNNMIFIIIGTVAGVLLIILVAIGTFCFIKYKKLKAKTSCQNTEHIYDTPDVVDKPRFYAQLILKDPNQPGEGVEIGHGSHMYDKPNFDIFNVEDASNRPDSPYSRPPSAMSVRSQGNISMTLDNAE